MVKYIISMIAVGSIVFLGLAIDTQSRIQPARQAVPTGPTDIFANGRVEGASEELELLPQLHGRVAKLQIAESSPVAAGDVLLQLDDREYVHKVASARAQLQLAQAKLQRLVNGAQSEERKEATALLHAKQAELERARLNWNRIRQLRSQNAVTEQEADDHRMDVMALEAAVEAAQARDELLKAPARQDEVAMAQAAVDAAQANLEAAQLQLDRTKLVTPSAGLILMVNTEVGELTGPDATQPAIVLADTSRHRVRAFVEEYDAPRVGIGMTASVTADGVPGQVFRGTVTRLSPRMNHKHQFSNAPDEQYDTKTREVWIDLDPQDNSPLVIGLRVDVVIHASPPNTPPATRPN